MDESDVTSLMDLAAAVLGCERLSADWMQRPQPALDGQRPADLLGSPEGRAAVELLLSRLEWGVYT
jgi:putative toxin-antitoxin system antitoxin component (TIGR02293 family)